MLVKNFFHRMNTKYLFSNFHPLFFLFYFGFLLTALGLIVGFFIINAKLQGVHPSGATAILCALLLNVGIQSIFFATLFDMMEEKRSH
mgnify:CR=1 FL=1